MRRETLHRRRGAASSGRTLPTANESYIHSCVAAARSDRTPWYAPWLCSSRVRGPSAPSPPWSRAGRRGAQAAQEAQQASLLKRSCCLLVCRRELVRRPRRSRRGSDEQAYRVQSRVSSRVIPGNLE